VPPALVKERARRLREACAARKTPWLQGLVGSKQRVLVERDVLGHAENFARVKIAPSHQGGGLSGQIIDVRITGVENEMLIGVQA